MVCSVFADFLRVRRRPALGNIVLRDLSKEAHLPQPPAPVLGWVLIILFFSLNLNFVFLCFKRSGVIDQYLMKGL